MIKAIVVFGTRPEAIKLATVITQLKNNNSFDVRVCVTAQHREMLDQVLRLFEITPDYDLDLMQANQSLPSLSSAIMDGIIPIFNSFKPDWVIVQGDTTTTFIAALAAYYSKLKIAHVEAGLRTNDLYSPWPEEGNRRLTSAISNIHFAPTETNKANLLIEGIDTSSVHVTGNTVIDALLATVDILEDKKQEIHEMNFGFLDPRKKLILVTTHRRENFGEGLDNICKAILLLSMREDVQIVLPVHLNPRVREQVITQLSSRDNIHLIEPLDYLPFVYLMKHAYLILTDSGGVQEEAPSLGKPVLVMRNTTERTEAVSAGTVRLVGTNALRIVEESNRLLDNKSEYNAMATIKNPYGDSRAAENIVNVLSSC